jgi:hypothetical protein
MRGGSLAVLAGCLLTLAGCGDTLQDQPIGPTPLESVIVNSRFPVYWTGLKFAGMRVTGVVSDPGGAVTISYGDCLLGGQYTCVAPLSLVTSPDNSFLPVGAAPRRTHIRGVAASATQQGRTLTLRTGAVIVSVYARDAALARSAAQTMVPLNKAGVPGSALSAPLPDSGFDRIPLRSQVPPGTPLPR